MVPVKQNTTRPRIHLFQVNKSAKLRENKEKECNFIHKLGKQN